LGPWNLREYFGIGLVILDWEYAVLAPAATDELWHAVTLRLATSRRSAELMGMEARDELRMFYADTELRSAASFLVDRWKSGEPAEIGEETPKSRHLLRSEDRVAKALGQFLG
jgi:hypothetical protein